MRILGTLNKCDAFKAGSWWYRVASHKGSKTFAIRESDGKIEMGKLFVISEEDLERFETLSRSDLGRVATVIQGCIQFVEETKDPTWEDDKDSWYEESSWNSLNKSAGV